MISSITLELSAQAASPNAFSTGAPILLYHTPLFSSNCFNLNVHYPLQFELLLFCICVLVMYTAKYFIQYLCIFKTVIFKKPFPDPIYHVALVQCLSIEIPFPFALVLFIFISSPEHRKHWCRLPYRNPFTWLVTREHL